jgi:hypothetical protein
MINKAESPIYQKSAAEAAKFEETDLWRNSFKLNMEVKKAIEADASMAYHEKRGKLFLDKLVSEYGVDRPLYVLARTVKMKGEYDGRFSPEVKTIAEKYDYPDMKLKYDNTQQYVTDVHSVFVDEMVYRLTEMKGILEKQRQKEENGKKLEVTMPDDSVTVADRNSFGYTWDGMLPLSTEKAVELFANDQNVYYFTMITPKALQYPLKILSSTEECAELKLRNGRNSLILRHITRNLRTKNLNMKRSYLMKQQRQSEFINSMIIPTIVIFALNL